MTKILILISFYFIVFCMGVPQKQRRDSGHGVKTPSTTNEDKNKFEPESRHDYDRVTEKEIKLTRKVKRVKDGNHRRVLDNLLPTYNVQGYRKNDKLEEVINKSNTTAPKKNEDTITETFADEDTNDNDKNVENKAVEHITESENINQSSNEDSKNISDVLRSSSEHEENSSKIETTTLDQEHNHMSLPLIQEISGRSGRPDPNSAKHMLISSVVDPLQESRIGSVPISRVAEMHIPYIRTALPRNSVFLNPSPYTVHTIAPLFDQVTTHNLIQTHRMLGVNQPNSIISRMTPYGRQNTDQKLIDDYQDNGSNNYVYSPSNVNATVRPHKESQTKASTKVSLETASPLREDFRRMSYSMFPRPGVQPLTVFRDSLWPQHMYS